MFNQEQNVAKRLNGKRKRATEILSKTIPPKYFRVGEHVECSSDREEEGEEIASVNGSEDKDTQESDNMTLKTTVTKQKVVTLKRSPPFTQKMSVNIARTLMCTGD